MRIPKLKVLRFVDVVEWCGRASWRSQKKERRREVAIEQTRTVEMALE
jgi:hypothetical protein